MLINECEYIVNIRSETTNGFYADDDDKTFNYFSKHATYQLMHIIIRAWIPWAGGDIEFKCAHWSARRRPAAQRLLHPEKELRFDLAILVHMSSIV